MLSEKIIIKISIKISSEKLLLIRENFFVPITF
jgi:hypothetical protein